MRKFKFSLEPLGRVRALAVRRQEVTFARAQEERVRADELCRESESELRRALHTGPRGGRVGVRDLMDLDAERRRLHGQLRHAEEKAVGAAGRVEEARLQLLEAQRDQKVLGKLREKRYLEYLGEILRQEQKALDEVAARGARQKRAA
jgi:flagellar protein FliJ